MSCGGPGRVFELWQGDLLPVYVVDVKTCAGEFDFTGWTVVFRMRGPVQVSGPASGDSHGVLTYVWAAGDTSVAGDYEPLFVGTSPEGKQQTFHVAGTVRVSVP